MTELHVGLIGAGNMGASLAGGFAPLDNARVSAIADPAEGAAARLAEELADDGSIQAYTDVKEMLARDDISAVVVAVPNFLHAEVVRQAARAGKHIFCEKPMALNVADARSMIEAAEQNEVKLMIGQVLRYIPPYVWMKDLCASGELGQAFAMQTTRLGGGWGGKYHAPWRMKKETCGGPLFEIAAHEIDFMRQILGEAETVYASMGNYVNPDVDYEDLAHVLINFQGGGRGCLLTGHAGFMGTYDGKIYCTEGTIFFDNKTGQVTYQRKGDEKPTTLPYADTAEGYEPGVQREVREFVEAVLNDTEVTIPGTEGLRNTEVGQAAHISAADNRVVTLPL